MNDKKQRCMLSLGIITLVLLVSILLIITTRAPSGRINMKVISDGADGAIVAWCTKHTVRAQRIDRNGELLWDRGDILGGVKIEQPSHFDMIGDGQGGAVIMWGDSSQLTNDREDPSYYSPAPVYCQRLNARGEPLWCEGVNVGGAEHYGYALSLPQIAPVGDGGIFVVWNDYQVVHRGLKDDYYRIQRFSPAGEKLWNEDGILICSSDPFRQITQEEIDQGIKGTWIRSGCECAMANVINDGSKGAIVAWTVWEEGEMNKLYAQHYNEDGTVLWNENGESIAEKEGVELQSLINDGVGGAIISMYAEPLTVQRINGSGELLWSDKGIFLKNGASNMAGDDKGGFIYYRIETLPPYGQGPVFTGQNVLHIQKIDDKGNPVWQDLSLFTGEKGQMLSATLMDDETNGAFIAWRTWEHANWEGEISAQKISADGRPLWGESGKKIFPSVFRYQGSPFLMNDSSGGLIIMAVTGKNPINGDVIFAQKIDAEGNAVWQDGVKISH